MSVPSRILPVVLCAILCRSVTASGAPAEAAPAAPPARSAIVTPECSGGVKQLMLLSSRWVVVIVDEQQRVLDRIDALSGGQLYKASDDWAASEAAGRPNWTAFKLPEKLREQYGSQAREETGERRLDTPAAFTVAVNGGPARPPRRVTRAVIGTGAGKVVPGGVPLKGRGRLTFVHACYLELPEPLVDGQRCTIDVAAAGRVTFAYDERRSVSRAIKVNQAGYLPGVRGKYAYLGAWLQHAGPHDFSFARTFEVVDSDSGKVVFQGPVTLRDAHSRMDPVPGKTQDPATRPPLTGEDVYEMDLGGLKAEGSLFIRVPGVGRSWGFRHAPDTYGEVFYTACRALYHQRCGVELKAPWTRWPRRLCHTNDVYECAHIPWSPGAEFKRPKDYRIFDVIGGSIDRTRATPDVRGGWHDAADWDRGIHHYAAVFDLLNAFDLRPGAFVDGQLNIPESGNGIPDVLDEVLFGLEVWRRSQAPDGGVSGMVETWTHPPIDAPGIDYAFSRRTRWSSLVFAAAGAQFARLVQPYDAALSQRYADAARRAWSFGTDPSKSLGKVEIPARGNRGKGEPYSYTWEETDDMIGAFRVHAAVQMQRLTGDDAYLRELAVAAKGNAMPYAWPNTYGDFSPWMKFGLAHNPPKGVPADLAAEWRGFFTRTGAELAALNDRMPYRVSWPRHQDFWMSWGAGSFCNRGRALLIAHAIDPRPEYREAAVQDVDYMLGANPLGMSWTTGIGQVYPVDIQHANSEDDGILDPVPGITIYGVTGGMYARLRGEVWSPPDGKGGRTVFYAPPADGYPYFRTWSPHPAENTAQCEFTISETVAGTLFAAAMLVPDGWLPDPALKQRGPRPDAEVHGYYALP